MEGICSGCGRWVEGGKEGCRARFEELVGRDFGNPLFFAVHRQFVDTYCLQHPDEFCVSAKSLAAHLVGLCLILEHGISAATGSARLRRGLNGSSVIEKPPLPAARGSITLGDLETIEDPAAWREAVQGWAESTWEAYRHLHQLARSWATSGLGPLDAARAEARDVAEVRERQKP